MVERLSTIEIPHSKRPSDLPFCRSLRMQGAVKLQEISESKFAVSLRAEDVCQPVCERVAFEGSHGLEFLHSLHALFTIRWL